MKCKRAVFFDRDGTLIKAIERPDHPKKITAPFELGELYFLPAAITIMKLLKKWGWLRILITNQPDVAHGYLSQETWQKIQREVVRFLEPDDVFMCRHIDDSCPMKKPSPMMILAASDKWGIDLSQSFMVGDSSKDIEAGKAAGCKTIQMKTTYENPLYGYADYVASSMLEVIETLKIERERSNKK